MITQKVCRIEWEEDCSTSKKKIGEKVVYDKKCEDREVQECKTVQVVYQDFPSLGIAGGAGKPYQECEMVTKEFCEDVPRNEDVIGDVETCVNSPKEVSELSAFHPHKLPLES